MGRAEAGRGRGRGILVPGNITDTFTDIARVRLVVVLARKTIEPLARGRGQQRGCGGHGGGAGPGVRVMDDLGELLEAVVHHRGLAAGRRYPLLFQ